MQVDSTRGRDDNSMGSSRNGENRLKMGGDGEAFKDQEQIGSLYYGQKGSH